MAGEKKHQPTQKKLADARKEGQIPRSKDVGAWASIAGTVAVIPLVIESAIPRLRRILAEELPKAATIGDPQIALNALGDVFLGMALALMPLALTGVILAFGGNAIQGGVVFGEKALKPKWERLNPLKGIKQMFSMKTLWEAVKALIKTIILVAVLWYIIDNLVPVLRNAGTVSLSALIGLIGRGVFQIVQITVLVGLALAVIDYIVTRKQMHKDLRMSDQDIKDEYKQAEGDPQLKGAIKSRQMAMSRNRMMSETATADVIMANPTHLSIALKYSAETGAPKVVAKGQGLVALRIREAAAEAGVPIVQDIPLARALYYSCEMGEEIPGELYTAVATVLAFVMRLQHSHGTDDMLTIPGGAPDVPADLARRTAKKRR